MSDLYFVYNPRSGSTPTLSVLEKKCQAAGLDIREFIAIDDDMRARLAGPIADGATILVLGGDGTMNTFANLLVHTKATLAPLSGGTFNHFTKDLGVPQNLDAALAKLRHARMQAIDTVRVNGVYFVNNSMLGLYPHSLRIRSRLESKYGKWPAAIVAVARTLFRFHTYYITIGSKKYRTPYVFIGNNKFGLKELGLPGRHKFDAGEMSVYVAHARTRWSVMKLTLMAAVGKLHEAEEFDILEVGKKFTIQTRRRHMHVSHDGELTRMRAPLRYEMQPKSLRVLR